MDPHILTWQSLMQSSRSETITEYAPILKSGIFCLSVILALTTKPHSNISNWCSATTLFNSNAIRSTALQICAEYLAPRSNLISLIIKGRQTVGNGSPSLLSEQDHQNSSISGLRVCKDIRIKRMLTTVKQTSIKVCGYADSPCISVKF